MEQYVVAPRKVLDTLKHLVRNQNDIIIHPAILDYEKLFWERRQIFRLRQLKKRSLQLFLIVCEINYTIFEVLIIIVCALAELSVKEFVVHCTQCRTKRLFTFQSFCYFFFAFAYADISCEKFSSYHQASNFVRIEKRKITSFQHRIS